MVSYIITWRLLYKRNIKVVYSDKFIPRMHILTLLILKRGTLFESRFYVVRIIRNTCIDFKKVFHHQQATEFFSKIVSTLYPNFLFNIGYILSQSRHRTYAF